jgi:hypothetical protein
MSASVGQRYGEGYGLSNTNDWLKKIGNQEFKNG